jgi:hypothetical protein
MKAKLTCFILALIIVSSVKAQKFKQYQEFGPMIGVSYYIGDINPSRQFFQSKLAGGLMFRKNVNPRFSWRFNAVLGSVRGDDALSNNPFQLNRNLSFRSPIGEFAALLEFNFLPYEVGDDAYRFTPFIFGGLAVFYQNPQALIDGVWVPLQPLGTEGQGTTAYPAKKPYSLTNISTPFGVGIKWHFNNNIGFALEWGLRRTFTDYLDDVSTTYANPAALLAEKGELSMLLADRSLVEPGITNVGRQRGNSKTVDWYSFALLTITFKITAKEEECAAYK